ncbi:MAG: TonB-dependent receptor [Filimonas sp.]|nr:TonB-dependent receptor [Filimonas sp.]
MRKLTLIIFLLSVAAFAHAQKIIVRGTIKDKEGLPVEAATVQQVDNNKNVVIADDHGRFEISITGGNPKIRIQSAGFIPMVVDASKTTELNLTLENDNTNMNEVVVVGMAKQKKITNTGAVSSITGKELRQSPSASIQNALAGRLPGLFQQQTSGQPGKDAANIYIRGISSYASGTTNRPLVIVDDVEFPYDQLAQIDANEIESVSILKDASTTAIYGIKGANGVIILTTRRGKEGKARVTFRTEAGLQKPTILRKPLSSYDALVLLKEQAVNQGQDPNTVYPGLVTDEALAHFKAGDDPYRYPNVNWYDQVMRNNALIQRNNLDIAGGTKNIRYFLSLGYINQEGILKNIQKSEDFNNNYYLRRYNVRSNVDVDVTKDLTLRLDMNARFNEINEPNLPDVTPGGSWPFWRRITSGILTPWKYPVYNADGSYGGAKGESLNPVGLLQYGGYKRSYTNNFNLNLSGTQKLDFITKGLSVKGIVAFTNNFGFSRSLTRGRFPVFAYLPGSTILDPVFPDLSRIEPLAKSTTYDSTTYPFRRLNLQGVLNYTRQFGVHNVYGLVMINQSSDITSSRAPANFKGYAARVGYNYKSKYMVEFNAGYNGSDRFQGKNRYGFMPAASVGWNISEENFFKNNVRFINYFKIRGSYGQVGSDDVGGYRYIYEEVYTRATGAYYFGETPTAQARITPGQLANQDVRWEVERKADIGVDMKFFNSRLELTADYFDNLRYDILTVRESVPQYTGLSLPPVNIGKVSNKGLEIDLTWHDKIGRSWNYFAKGNISIAKNKILFRDEPENAANPLLKKTGRPIGQQYGYTSLGFYYDDADIAKSPKVIGRTVKPGDLKYADINGDGQIDQSDIGPIGYSNIPQITYGFSGGFSYKTFDFSFLFQGAARGSLMANTMLQIGTVNGLPMAIHQKRWTPETRDVAEYPRLGGDNFAASTFWLRPTDYLRLKNVEIGYRFPKSIVNRLKLNDIRVYMNGMNLYTWFKLKIYDIDPESLSGGGTVEAYSDYPQQKIFNAGVQITF